MRACTGIYILYISQFVESFLFLFLYSIATEQLRNLHRSILARFYICDQFTRLHSYIPSESAIELSSSQEITIVNVYPQQLPSTTPQFHLHSVSKAPINPPHTHTITYQSHTNPPNHTHPTMSSRNYSSSTLSSSSPSSSGTSRSTIDSNTTYTQNTSSSGSSSSRPIVHNSKRQACKDGWSSSKGDDERYYKGSFYEQKGERSGSGYVASVGGRR